MAIILSLRGWKFNIWYARLNEVKIRLKRAGMKNARAF